jgi:soluble lytic murein transglycosylase
MIHWIQRSKAWLLVLIFLGGLVTLIERWRGHREHSQDAVILTAGAHHGVDPALIKAVVWRESWFDPKARGSSGEIGLMQIREPTARDWATAERAPGFTHPQLFDPGKNTECGAWYLRRLLYRYQGTDNPLPYALAAYNAGPSHVARWRTGSASTNSAEFLRRLDFPGTRRYVQTVMKRYQHYHRDFPPKKSA